MGPAGRDRPNPWAASATRRAWPRVSLSRLIQSTLPARTDNPCRLRWQVAGVLDPQNLPTAKRATYVPQSAARAVEVLAAAGGVRLG
jgi:hypothetical protein